ncbi:MAG: alpha/beta fold hydrolase [Chloroflexi bacterium]|nr:alpha/beta fold hydrolase [Chloroflexota bacterium]
MRDEAYDLSFSRNIGILTAAEQESLRNSTVTIIGLGGIGGNTLMLLARMGIGNFRLADFDRFDLNNINRQYGAFVDTRGRLKCDMLTEEVRRVNPLAQIRVFPEGFSDDCDDALFKGADLVIDAVDFYAIETHLQIHRKTRDSGLFTIMGSPVGFSACLQIFDPNGMSLEEYCGIQPDMSSLEKQLRYACGLVPELAHIEYFDVSAGNSNTNFLEHTGPSLACATALAASLVAAETVVILLGRRKPLAIPYTFQFDPYTFRYERTFVKGGMACYNPDPAIARIPDKSSLITQVMQFLYKKQQAERAHVNGADFYYRVEGDGPRVLLIGPLGADSSFWARQAQELANQFQVITFDNRGSGSSSPCTSGCSTQLLAEDVIALLEHLGVEKSHIVGMALGGLIAQHVAVKRPDLVDRLVLISSYALADERISRITREWRAHAVEKGMESLFDACVEWLFSDDYLTSNEGELRNLRTFYRLNLQDPLSFCEQSLAGIRHDSRHLIGKVNCPTLVIHGGADRLVRVQLARALAEGIPHSRLSVLDRAAHFLTWEQASAVNAQLVEFLAVETG